MEKLILHPHKTPIPRTTTQTLHLTAWSISSEPTLQRDFWKRLPTWLQRQGDLQPGLLIIPASTSTSDGAGVTKSVHIEPLLEQFKQKAKPRSVRCFRTAIASIHHGFDGGLTVSSSPTLTNLIKGAFHEPPPQIIGIRVFSGGPPIQQKFCQLPPPSDTVPIFGPRLVPPSWGSSPKIWQI